MYFQIRKAFETLLKSEQHIIRQRIHSLSGCLGKHILLGRGWTFGCILLIGLIIASFLQITVYSRSIEQLQAINEVRRIHLRVTFWIEHGFFKHAGLHFSESPEMNPKAFVYRSSPPASSYPLYIMNLLNYRIRGEKFNFRLYVVYTQALLWISALCLGFLGVRLARRLGATPLLAFTCGATGQIIFHTFPYHLQKYFEPTPEQMTCLALLCFLLIEELDVDQHYRSLRLFQGLCCFLMAYFCKALAVPGLGMYFLARILLREGQTKKIVQLFIAMCLGVILHLAQLGWVLLKFPEVSVVGSTFLWRSGLDGATNYVGILTPDMLGAGNMFLRNVGVFSLIIILFLFLRKEQQLLKTPLLLIMLPVSFYLVPGYLLSQWAMIHPYAHDIFLAVASILAFCYILIPYLERATGNTGIITCILVIIGFCLSMYQLRKFAIAYPLPIPEPDWRLYWPLG